MELLPNQKACRCSSLGKALEPSSIWGHGLFWESNESFGSSTLPPTNTHIMKIATSSWGSKTPSCPSVVLVESYINLCSRLNTAATSPQTEGSESPWKSQQLWWQTHILSFESLSLPLKSRSVIWDWVDPTEISLILWFKKYLRGLPWWSSG